MHWCAVPRLSPSKGLLCRLEKLRQGSAVQMVSLCHVFRFGWALRYSIAFVTLIFWGGAVKGGALTSIPTARTKRYAAIPLVHRYRTLASTVSVRFQYGACGLLGQMLSCLLQVHIPGTSHHNQLLQACECRYSVDSSDSIRMNSDSSLLPLPLSCFILFADFTLPRILCDPLRFIRRRIVENNPLGSGYLMKAGSFPISS